MEELIEEGDLDKISYALRTSSDYYFDKHKINTKIFHLSHVNDLPLAKDFDDLLYLHDKRRIGYLLDHAFANKNFILIMKVLEESRGKGIASMIIENLLSYKRKNLLLMYEALFRLEQFEDVMSLLQRIHRVYGKNFWEEFVDLTIENIMQYSIYFDFGIKILSQLLYQHEYWVKEKLVSMDLERKVLILVQYSKSYGLRTLVEKQFWFIPDCLEYEDIGWLMALDYDDLKKKYYNMLATAIMKASIIWDQFFELNLPRKLYKSLLKLCRLEEDRDFYGEIETLLGERI